MLWIWLGRAFFWFLRLFLPRSILPPPPAKPKQHKPLSLKEPCPACHRPGTVTVEHVTVSTMPGKPAAVRQNAMLYSCSACKAFWYCKPDYAVGYGGKQLGPDDIHGREVKGLAR